MAPRVETPKAMTKVHQTIVKANATKGKASSAVVSKKNTNAEKTPLKVDTTSGTRQRTKTVPNLGTPKPTDKKLNSVTKSAKKAMWKRKPKPAHSGVPLTEKMKRLKKQLEDPDCSL